MTKRHITQVTSYFPPHLGGMENCVLHIAQQLSNDGYSVEVLTSNAGFDKNHAPKTTFPTYYLPSIEFAHTPWMPTLFFRLLAAPKNTIFHVHIAQAFTPEAVFLAAKLKRTPYVAHVHLDVDASGPLGFLLAPYKKIFLRLVLKNASKIICLTSEQKKSITKRYHLSENKIAIVPNGVGDEFFVKRTTNKTNGVLKILFVGRLVPQKNVGLLLAAAKYIKTSVQIDIVGDGEDKDQLEREAKQQKLTSIRFHGTKSGKELINFYKNADLFVLPSIKEGLSLSLLEAMAAGLPIVAARSEGMVTLVGDAGLIVANPTPQRFATAVDQLLNDKQRRKNMSQNAQARAKKLTWQHVTSEIEKIYDELSN